MTSEEREVAEAGGGVEEKGGRRKKFFFLNFKKGILVFSNDLVAKMNHFYCSVAKMRPFIVCRPN